MRHNASQFNLGLGSTASRSPWIKFGGKTHAVNAGRKRSKQSRGKVPLPRNRGAINLDMLTPEVREWLMKKLNVA